MSGYPGYHYAYLAFSDFQSTPPVGLDRISLSTQTQSPREEETWWPQSLNGL